MIVFFYFLNKVAELLRQSFSGNETEVHEAEQILLNMDISCDFVTTLFDIIKSENMDVPIKYSALIRLKQIVAQNWLVSLNADVKSLIFTNFFEILYSVGPSYNKLFQLFSNIIIDRLIILNECPDLFSLIQLDPEHQFPSLILLKSIAHHFKHKKIDENPLYEQFCNFFIQSTFQLFLDSQSYSEILLIFNSFYYLIMNNPNYFKTLESQIILGIISKFELFIEFQDDETYQQCLKHASKTIHLLFIKSVIPADISSDLLISIFNISLRQFTEDLNPRTRNHLTRLICKLFDYQIIIKYFFNDISNIIGNVFLPAFASTEVKGEIFDHVFEAYDLYSSSIFIIQSLSIKNPDFLDFLQLNLIQFIQHIFELDDQNQFNNEAYSLLSYAKLASSSLQISDESLLQIPLFQSDIEILRVIGFTISANFCGILPTFLFQVFLDHLNDESNIVCQLSAVSAIKCLRNEDLELNETEFGFVAPLFEAYLTITENPDLISISSLKLLKKLLQISSPCDFLNPILSSLVARLIQLSTEESNDGELVSTVCKRICQILQLCSNDSDFESETDSFVSELISIYGNFDDFFKEKILSIFQTSAEFCFSAEVSWNIASIFEFGTIFEDEMMVLRKLLISAKIESAFDMDAIQFLLNKLFEQIEKDPNDDKIVLNSLSDILSALFGLDDENVDSFIYQQMIPLIIEKMQIDILASSVSKLISCIFIFFKKCEKEFDYQPFIEFWIENAEYPYYCASSILILQDFISDFDLCLAILLKICDELSGFGKENDSQPLDEFEFPELTLQTIVTDLLKLIKYLKAEVPELYELFYQKAELFIDETLPQIVDNICS